MVTGDSSTPSYAVTAMAEVATGAVEASRFQLPPSDALPVRSVEAATTSPVMADKPLMKCCPVLPCAVSQPYSRMSPCGFNAALISARLALCEASVASSRVSVPSVTAPVVPWLMMWTASRPVMLFAARKLAISCTPLPWPLNSTTSAPGRCAAASSARVAASATLESTKTISLLPPSFAGSSGATIVASE